MVVNGRVDGGGAFGGVEQSKGARGSGSHTGQA